MNYACIDVDLGQINSDDLKKLMENHINSKDALVMYQDLATSKLDAIKPFEMDTAEALPETGRKRKRGDKMPSSSKKPREATDVDASEAVAAVDDTSQNDTNDTAAVQNPADDNVNEDNCADDDPSIKAAEFKPKMSTILRGGLDSSVVEAIERTQTEATNIMHETLHLMSLQLLKV